MKTVPVSVIIPCYCCAAEIERSVDSVFEQSVLPREVLLVDDASPDVGATRAAMARVAKRYAGMDEVSIRLLFQDENGGPGLARNTGWNAATQEYIAFLDADDSWLREKLSVQEEWMSKHLEVSLSGHSLDYANADLLSRGAVPSRLISLRSMLFKNQLLTTTIMIRRAVGHRFAAGERYSEDYSLWLRILADGGEAVLLDAPLARAHRPAYSQGGLSSALWKMERAELRIFRQLAASEKISASMSILASIFSLFKFVLRVLRLNRSAQ